MPVSTAGRTDDAQAAGVILVIEDDADVRGGTVAVLEAEGYRAVGVPTAYEALALLRARKVKPSVILLDLMMPGMTGGQFRAEQLQDAELGTVPVILVSAFPNTLEVTQKGSLRGAAALMKPVEPRRLLAVIARYCRYHRPAV